MVWLVGMGSLRGAGVGMSCLVSPVQTARAVPWDAVPGRVSRGCSELMSRL